MTSGTESLASLVAAEHRTWTDPIVCQGVFGSTNPTAIAERIDALCREALGSAIASARFYRVSVGCVAGVELDDERAVVVKVQRTRRSPASFAAMLDVRRHLAREGFPCPEPVGDVVTEGDRITTFEALVERGARADAHDPRIRRALAASLARVVELTRPFVGTTPLGGAWFTSIPDGRLWPRPHTPLVDFEATAEGAGWIDEIAARARAVRGEAAGKRVLGHFDWRVEHARFDPDGEVVATYDWDSLHDERETVMVGAAAHAFTADWSRSDIVRVPRIAEIAGFVDDYEAARGSDFAPAERRTIAASCVYSLSYTARCNHALAGDGDNGDFRPLLRAEAGALLAGEWI